MRVLVLEEGGLKVPKEIWAELLPPTDGPVNERPRRRPGMTFVCQTEPHDDFYRKYAGE